MMLMVHSSYSTVVTGGNDYPIHLALLKKINYSRLGRVWLVTSRLGTGKWQTFFYCVASHGINDGREGTGLTGDIERMEVGSGLRTDGTVGTSSYCSSHWGGGGGVR
jgi:hypothetical protein